MCITEKEFKYVTCENWESRNFYVLPKLYKSEMVLQKLKDNWTYLEMETPWDLEGRPIVAGPISPTQHLSELTHYILSPLVPFITSYVKDDLDFLRKCPPKIPYACDLWTCDIIIIIIIIHLFILGLCTRALQINIYRNKNS